MRPGHAMWNQIYQTIAEALGAEANIVHVPSDFIARVAPEMSGSLLGDKTWSVVSDNRKIKAAVPGWQATIPLRRGLCARWRGSPRTSGGAWSTRRWRPRWSGCWGVLAPDVSWLP